jgi:hypothetical protein
MTATIAELRAALVDALSTVDALNVLSYMPEQPPVPCAVLYRSGGSPRTDFGRTSPSYEFTVRVLVSRADAMSAQESLDLYVERGTDMSIWDALETDVTLGGTCHTIRCGDVSGDTVVFAGEVPYLSADFTVTVYPA